jgi:hypothetical protein
MTAAATVIVRLVGRARVSGTAMKPQSTRAVAGKMSGGHGADWNTGGDPEAGAMPEAVRPRTSLVTVPPPVRTPGPGLRR